MSEKITAVCPECSAKLAVPETAAGKMIRCPKCQGTVPVPSMQAPAPRAKRRSVFEEPDASPNRPKQRSARKDADPWTDDSVSSYNNAGDDWDSYGATESVPAALPPRSKLKNRANTAPKLLGTGNEPPESEYYKVQRSSVINSGPMITGVLMMVGAAIWFFGGLAAGVIFFYPPVLFVLGLISFLKGMFGGE